MPSVSTELSRGVLHAADLRERLGVSPATLMRMVRDAGLDVDRFAEHRKLPAAYVIEQAGMKGSQVGDIQSSPVHANFLVNHGGGTAAQVDQLMSEIKEAVRARYGLEMQEEIQRVGF